MGVLRSYNLLWINLYLRVGTSYRTVSKLACMDSEPNINVEFVGKDGSMTVLDDGTDELQRGTEDKCVCQIDRFPLQFIIGI